MRDRAGRGLDGEEVVCREYRQHPGPADLSKWDLCSVRGAAAEAAIAAAKGTSRLQQHIYKQQKSANS